MATLHIEHAISAFDEWKAAFDRFGEMRTAAGVRGHTIRRPVDDDHFVVIDLEFDSAPAATAFLGILRERVWPSKENAPALVGAPQARVLEDADSG
jgi:hypothetical protein